MIPLESQETKAAQERVMTDVSLERKRQDEKWGQQDHIPSIWMAILGEEFGELCQEALRYDFGGVIDRNLRDEAIQVAAVAVAIVEYIDRNNLLGE